MSDIKVTKDSKGSAYIISHKRCGMTECIFVSVAELQDLQAALAGVLDDIREKELAQVRG